jgi:acetyl-CoA synthetase
MTYPYQIKSLEAYHKAYAESIENPSDFWTSIAENFVWKRKWNKTLDWNFEEPKATWFAGGKLNITENCLDRHIDALGDKPAIIWESNNPEEQHRILTYKELLFKVKQFAYVLKNNGVRK